MLIPLIVLAAVSFVVCLGGGIWLVMRYGETERGSGPEVGAALVADLMEDEEALTVAEATAFRGKAVEVGRSVEIDFSEIKAALRMRQWHTLLPILLAMGGLVGVLVFGSLALLVGVEDKVVGVAAVLLVLYTLARIGLDFRRA